MEPGIGIEIIKRALLANKPVIVTTERGVGTMYKLQQVFTNAIIVKASTNITKEQWEIIRKAELVIFDEIQRYNDNDADNIKDYIVTKAAILVSEEEVDLRFHPFDSAIVNKCFIIHANKL